MVSLNSEVNDSNKLIEFLIECISTIKVATKNYPKPNISERQIINSKIKIDSKLTIEAFAGYVLFGEILKKKIVLKSFSKSKIETAYRLLNSLIELLNEELNYTYSKIIIDLLIKCLEVETTASAQIVFQRTSFYCNDRIRNRLIIPEILQEISTSNLIAMEWINGVKINSNSEFQTSINIQLKNDLLDLNRKLIFEENLFRYDTHYSNYLVQKDNIALFDFGSVINLNLDLNRKFIEQNDALNWIKSKIENE